MKKFVASIGLLAFAGVAFAAANSSFSSISNFETRSAGSHAVYLAAGVPTTEGCDYNDRGVLVDGDAGSKTMTAMLVYAMSASKLVQVRVDGCTVLSPGVSSATAPKIVKVQVQN